MNKCKKELIAALCDLVELPKYTKGFTITVTATDINVSCNYTPSKAVENTEVTENTI